jgi:hypothetical protein
MATDAELIYKREANHKCLDKIAQNKLTNLLYMSRPKCAKIRYNSTEKFLQKLSSII